MKKTLLMLMLLGLAAFATAAPAVQLFDFDAQAVMPSGVGGTAAVYGRIVNGVAVGTPLPLDLANYEYTIVVTGLTQNSDGVISQFSGGMIAIYEDAGTAADWATPSSFSDGAAILTGTLAVFQRSMLTATLGSGAGSVDWTGGTMLGLLAPADRTGWPFLTSVSRAAAQVQPGYGERWDGKVEPRGEVVATEEWSWSELKAAFR